MLETLLLTTAKSPASDSAGVEEDAEPGMMVSSFSSGSAVQEGEGDAAKQDCSRASMGVRWQEDSTRSGCERA